MKILITGGAGFIGAHLAKALMESGEEVVLLDDLNSFIYPATLKQARLTHIFGKNTRPKLIIGNILDKKLLDQLFTEEKFDKVIHLAAHPNPGISVNFAEDYAVTNILGTINILEACTKHDIVQLIFAGSSSVYNDTQTPFREDAYPLMPHSPYGASKAAAETYCRMWHDLHGLSITVLRFFSVYGPWGRPDMAPMIFAEKVLNDQPIAVSSDRQRDFTYIDDIVSGIVAAVEQKFGFEIINIGAGNPVELKTFIAALEKAAGKKVHLTDRQAPEGEMRVTFADISKAKRMLGYEPKISHEEGAKRLIEWMKEWQ